MPERFSPDTEDQIAELIHWALAGKRTVAIQGSGSKSGFGYRLQTDCLLSTRSLSGILEYEPSELVMKALPGTPLIEIEEALAKHHQHLAFEPTSLGGLYNHENDKGNGQSGTIGGVFMGNLSGPRRFKSGAARDHILGIRAVSGRGEIYQSGGMVIKNVTGYDMSKLLTGSWGTLSILSEIAFKVLPAPAFTAAIAIADQRLTDALPLISELAGSPYELSGLAYLPKAITSVGASAGAEGVPTQLHGRGVTCLRLEGTRLSVTERITSVKKMVPDNLEVSVLEQEAAQWLWQAIGEVSFFSSLGHDRTIIKLSLPATSVPDMIAILEESADCRWYLDAAGGWVWASLPQHVSVQTINQLRRTASRHGGSVMIYAATEEIKTAAGLFSPMPEAMAGLVRRIKANFDPENLLNPGRLYRDW